MTTISPNDPKVIHPDLIHGMERDTPRSPGSEVASVTLPSAEDYGYELLQTARWHRQRGSPLIPILGDVDPTRPKAPAIPWKIYQSRLPSLEDLDEWFLKRKYGGLGLVCGVNDCVLDFDEPDLAQAFAEQHPDLANTRTVLSAIRKLPHYHYRISEGSRVHSQKVSGADLQGIGRYIIIPPTRLLGNPYAIINAVDARALSDADLARIHRFLDTCAPPATETIFSDVFLHADEKLSIEALVAEYHRLLHKAEKSRNDALFIVCRHGRNHGWTEDEVVASGLIETHVNEPAHGFHIPETSQQRREEALSTVKSVFSRLPRRHRASPHRGVPTEAREKFLTHHLEVVARLLDTLYLQGGQPGQHVTTETAIHIGGEFRIPPNAVRQALNATLAFPGRDPRPIFQAVQSQANSEMGLFTLDFHPTRSVMGGGGDSLQNEGIKSARRGRPPKRYAIPSLADLCALCEAVSELSDPIRPGDLVSNTAYRQAVHGGLIRRRPGTYSRNYLAERLGVSPRTTAKYDKQLGIEVTPQFEKREVSWQMLGTFPWGECESGHIVGVFLEDTEGTRYPPRRGLAAKLLARGEEIMFVTQLANHYRFSSESGAATNPAVKNEVGPDT